MKKFLLKGSQPENLKTKKMFVVEGGIIMLSNVCEFTDQPATLCRAVAHPSRELWSLLTS